MTERLGNRVAIFEDHHITREFLKDLITLSNNIVVLEASTMDEARDRIADRISEFGEIALDAVLLDGNLTSGDTNQDGEEIAGLLLGALGGEDIFLVSMSATELHIPGETMMYGKAPIKLAHLVAAYLSTRFGELPERID